MRELEIVATFDTPQTARACAKLLNAWFTWIMEGSSDETDEIEGQFDDFGLSFDDFSIDRDTDVDWGEEIPDATVQGNRIVVNINSKTGIDTIRELFGAMGAYDVTVAGEED